MSLLNIIIIRVILGHHFAFGPSLLNVQDTQHTLEVQNQRGGGILFEAIMEGEYSVDSFLFIGATLLSFLLLKDLDKSQGWFHSKGLVRMALFYVNRYLRITVPYILVMAFYIGVTPLIVSGDMGSAHLAQVEADSCRDDMWKHLLYINTFLQTSCMGQTWYLSCDMIMFLFSPLFIYSFWRGQRGGWQKVFGLIWWAVALLASISFSVWYVQVRTPLYSTRLPSPFMDQSRLLWRQTKGTLPLHIKSFYNVTEVGLLCLIWK